MALLLTIVSENFVVKQARKWMQTEERDPKKVVEPSKLPFHS